MTSLSSHFVQNNCIIPRLPTKEKGAKPQKIPKTGKFLPLFP